MSSGKSFNRHSDDQVEKHDGSNFNLGEYLVEISNGFISFAKLSEKACVLDIYSGNEEIPFEERDPRFKALLMQELFTDSKKSLKSKIRFRTF